MISVSDVFTDHGPECWRQRIVESELCAAWTRLSHDCTHTQPVLREREREREREQEQARARVRKSDREQEREQMSTNSQVLL